jgi:DNA-binding transcriptional MocR family regulator
MNSFLPDDYLEIEAKYFAELRNTGAVDAEPSGWRNGQSMAEKWAPLPQLRRAELVPYYIDEGDALAPIKERIAELLTAWDGYSIGPNEFTLCQSGAVTSLLTLVMLRNRGVTRIIFETPSYFASIEQAAEIGLEVDLVPTVIKNNYSLPPLEPWLLNSQNVAVWLTQPRASLGFNQPTNVIAELLDNLPRSSYVVVDEATDQTFPIHLGEFAKLHGSEQLIRLRSFTKGMGLNGLRLAAILHSTNQRSWFAGPLELVGGSLDIHSLQAVRILSENPERFRLMLGAANAQVNSLRARAEALVAGSPISVNRLVNGYIGSMVADLSVLGTTHLEGRLNLLEGCRRVRTPVMLGTSSYFAIDPPFEAMRLNFFRTADELLRGISNILRIWQDY